MKNFSKFSISLITGLVLGGCSAPPSCPFGMAGENCGRITITAYLPPVLADLSYRDIQGSKDQVIVQGGFQHALSMSGQEINLTANAPTLAPGIQIYPLANIPENAALETVTVLFEFSSTHLGPTETEKLDGLLKKIQSSNLMHMRINGHTDAIGSAGYNKKLSNRRAQSVLDYLARHGISKSKISTEGFGESNPADSNATQEGRAKNRRANLIPFTKIEK